jgi:hypothetical protein
VNGVLNLAAPALSSGQSGGQCEGSGGGVRFPRALPRIAAHKIRGHTKKSLVFDNQSQ